MRKNKYNKYTGCYSTKGYKVAIPLVDLLDQKSFDNLIKVAATLPDFNTKYAPTVD